MSQTAFFSVIMPVYNGALYIEDAIRSVISQTYLEWELIIVDDGSKDNSFEIAKSWQAKSEKIKVLQHQNAHNEGVSSSRNLAVISSKGNWISLLDADDTWFPGKLEKEAQIINLHPDIVLIYSKALRSCNDASIPVSEKSIYGTGTEGEVKDSFRKMISGFITSTSAVSFSKDTFDKCNGFNEYLSFSEDTLLFHQLMEHGNVYCIDDVLGTHRIHQLSTVAETTKEKKVVARFAVYDLLISNVKKENIPVVSFALVRIGLLKIFRYFILYPENNFNLVVESLLKTLKSSKVLFRHKIMAFLIFIIEIFISPLKIIWLKTR